MKYNQKQIRTILKPLIKECIKEVLFEEEGILSNVISEVVKGVQTPILESKKSAPAVEDLQDIEENRKKAEEERQRRIKRLNESAGVNVFENMTTEVADSPQGSPLSGVAPGDSGVDIDAIAKIANGKWKHLIK
jgi:negative regulator of genetic competence, sporulation and motility